MDGVHVRERERAARGVGAKGRQSDDEVLRRIGDALPLKEQVGSMRHAHTCQFGAGGGVQVRIILSETFAKDNSIDVEKPLQQAFEGHCNWQHPLLASFFTAVVSVATLLELAAKGRFHLSSYRCLPACNGCMCVRGGTGGKM